MWKYFQVRFAFENGYFSAGNFTSNGVRIATGTWLLEFYALAGESFGFQHRFVAIRDRETVVEWAKPCSQGSRFVHAPARQAAYATGKRNRPL